MPLKDENARADYSRKYYLEHRAELLAYSSAYQKRMRSKTTDYWKRYYDNKRDAVLAFYGAQCVCCGETDANFLTIDHVHGDGKRHRNSGVIKYLDIIREGFPDKYRVLCMNCNFAIRFGRTCPHNLIPFDAIGLAC